jgi:pilus assembly protein CpaE
VTVKLMPVPPPRKPVPATNPPPFDGRSVEVTALFRSQEAKVAASRELDATQNIVLRARTGTLASEVSNLIGSACDVLLVDVDLDDEHEMEALEAVARPENGVPVVVTAFNPSVEGLRQLMRHGIRDVVPQPFGRAELVQAIEEAARRTRRATAPRKPGTVVCILKGGGGVGATTIATQGGCALAQAAGGKRKKAAHADPSNFCVIDLDLQFGSVALQLDLDVGATVMDLVEKSGRLDGSMVRTSAIRHRSGVDIIAAPGSVQPLDVITPKTAVQLIDMARYEYGEVIVDMPGAWTTWTRALLAQASTIVMVVRPTVPSIRQARRQIETLVEEQLAHVPLTVVANRVRRGWFKHAISFREMQRALDHPVSHTIASNDEAMLEAADAGLMLSEVRGGRRSWREIQTFMSRTMDKARAADQPLAALGG